MIYVRMYLEQSVRDMFFWRSLDITALKNRGIAFLTPNGTEASAGQAGIYAEYFEFPTIFFEALQRESPRP
jgi:hypothetical protein